MLIRPWPILMLAILELLIPGFILGAAAWLHDLSPWAYAKLFFAHRSIWAGWIFFAAPAAASAAIYSVRAWGPTVLVTSTGAALAFHFRSWLLVPTIFE